MKSKLSEEIINWMLANAYNPEDLNQRGENGDSALMKATRDK